jgi:hypothetical protein
MQDKWFEKEMEMIDEDIWLCQGHEEQQEQKLKEWSKFNFQAKNKIRLCDSKTRTQDVQNKCENGSLLCKHEHEKNMTRLWCTIMLKINVEQTKKNEGLYFYLYPFGDLVQGSLQRDFYVCIK